MQTPSVLTPAGQRAAPPAAADERSLARLRWRCRRGMLENALILARFLDARGSSISDAEVAALDALLDLPDTELWDLLSGQAGCGDPACEPLLQQLRRA